MGLKKKHQSALDELRELVWQYTDLSKVSQLLTWDMRAGDMPLEGAENRANQKATLASLRHQIITSGKMASLLNTLNDPDILTHANFEDREVIEYFVRKTRSDKNIPDALVKKLAIAQTSAHAIWKKAREENNYTLFAPAFQQLIDVSKERAYHKGYEDNPYQAFIGAKLPGRKVDDINTVFNTLTPTLLPLLQKIQSYPQQDYPFAQAKLKALKLKKVVTTAITQTGFDFSRGYFDIGERAFCLNAGYNDIRVVGRYTPGKPFEFVTSSIHEVGHALIHQGMNPDLWRTPLAASYTALSEGQARFWENQIARSWHFWKWFLPKMKKEFPYHLKGVTVDEVYQAINQVNAQPLRIGSDELSYYFHILIRFEIEKGLFQGDFETIDLPDVWNEKMKYYLGIEPRTYVEGVLQDIHWSRGTFGYFPTYLYGNLYASQFYASMQDEIPDLEKQIARGKFDPIRLWLNDNLNQWGKTKKPKTLIKEVTGEALNGEHYLTYLQTKYHALYNLT